ncbi:MAG: hypothetical protein IT182_17280 [Acidobacteria bacterium]|nr:hypothetical protein [Acidobacteriota bacterium]
MLKRLTGLGKRSARDLEAPPEPRVSGGRMSLAEAKAVSQRYFGLHEHIQAAHRARDYSKVASLSRQTYALLPAFVAAWKREYGRWDIQSSVAVHTGGTIVAVLQDEDGVRLLQKTMSTVDELELWRPVGEAAAADLRPVGQIMAVVSEHPDVLRSALRDRLPDADVPRLETLAAWLEKTGRIRRVRVGKSYELTAM